MTKIASDPTPDQLADPADEALEPDFKPLTAQEAQAWRERQPSASPWRVLGVQCAVGALVALLAWLVAGSIGAWSAAWGALSAVLPAALMVRGMQRTARLRFSGAAMAGFLFWELVKIALTVAMLVAAPKLVNGLNWLALLAGFVVTLKTHWVVFMRTGRSRSV